jgi:hypothetical protein
MSTELEELKQLIVEVESRYVAEVMKSNATQEILLCEHEEEMQVMEQKLREAEKLLNIQRSSIEQDAMVIAQEENEIEDIKAHHIAVVEQLQEEIERKESLINSLFSEIEQIRSNSVEANVSEQHLKEIEELKALVVEAESKYQFEIIRSTATQEILIKSHSEELRKIRESLIGEREEEESVINPLSSETTGAIPLDMYVEDLKSLLLETESKYCVEVMKANAYQQVLLEQHNQEVAELHTKIRDLEKKSTSALPQPSFASESADPAALRQEITDLRSLLFENDLTYANTLKEAKEAHDTLLELYNTTLKELQDKLSRSIPEDSLFGAMRDEIEVLKNKLESSEKLHNEQLKRADAEKKSLEKNLQELEDEMNALDEEFFHSKAQVVHPSTLKAAEMNVQELLALKEDMKEMKRVKDDLIKQHDAELAAIDEEYFRSQAKINNMSATNAEDKEEIMKLRREVNQLKINRNQLIKEHDAESFDLDALIKLKTEIEELKALVIEIEAKHHVELIMLKAVQAVTTQENKQILEHDAQEVAAAAETNAAQEELLIQLQQKAKHYHNENMKLQALLEESKSNERHATLRCEETAEALEALQARWNIIKHTGESVSSIPVPLSEVRSEQEISGLTECTDLSPHDNFGRSNIVPNAAFKLEAESPASQTLRKRDVNDSYMESDEESYENLRNTTFEVTDFPSIEEVDPWFPSPSLPKLRESRRKAKNAKQGKAFRSPKVLNNSSSFEDFTPMQSSTLPLASRNSHDVIYTPQNRELVKAEAAATRKSLIPRPVESSPSRPRTSSREQEQAVPSEVIQQYEDKVKQLEASLLSARDEISELRTKLKSSGDSLNGSNEDVNALKEKVKQLTNEKALVLAEMSKLIQTPSAMPSLLSPGPDRKDHHPAFKAKDMEEKLSKSSAALKDAESRLLQSEQLNQKLKADYLEVEAKLKRANMDLSKMKADLDKANMKYAALKGKNSSSPAVLHAVKLFQAIVRGAQQRKRIRESYHAMLARETGTLVAKYGTTQG